MQFSFPAGRLIGLEGTGILSEVEVRWKEGNVGVESLRKKLKVPAIDMMRYRESAHHVPVPDKRSKRILGEKRGNEKG